MKFTLLTFLAWSISCSELLPRYEFAPTLAVSPTAIQFVDATGRVLDTDLAIEVQFVGPGSSEVVNARGGFRFDIIGATLQFGLDPDSAPSRQEPVEFSLVARANGYLTAVETFRITSREDSEMRIIRLISIDTPPPGVSIAQASLATDPSGALVEDLVVGTTPTSSADEQVVLTMSSGTRFFDADGAQMSGPMDVTLVHFDSETRESLISYPGGLSPNRVLDSDGNILPDMNFVTAGFVELLVEQEGRKASTFSVPLTIESELSPTVVNPTTGNPVQVGDSVDIFSLDEATGEWTQESQVLIYGAPSGKPSVSFEIPHLSYWNIDWGTERCESGVTIEVLQNTCSCQCARLIDASTQQVIKEEILCFDECDGSNGVISEFTLQNAPEDTDVIFEIDYPYSTCDTPMPLYTTEPFDACEGSPEQVVMLVVGIETVEVRVAGSCGFGRLLPTLHLWHRRQAGSPWQPLGLVEEGVLVASGLERGVNYEFLAWFDSRTYVFEASIQDDIEFELDLPPELCDAVEP